MTSWPDGQLAPLDLDQCTLPHTAPPFARQCWGAKVMSSSRNLWIGLGALLLASFAGLLWVGGEIHRVMPPVPSAVVTTDGETIFTRADIEKGRQVWQSIGGHQLGSIWGHGSYVAPDWTADWLHREALAWLDL